MGNALDNLMKRLGVFVPAYPNPRPAGDPMVDAHWRSADPGVAAAHVRLNLDARGDGELYRLHDAPDLDEFERKAVADEIERREVDAANWAAID